MTQEKPFEIKEVFNIMDNHTISLNRVVVEPTFGRLALELANYAITANDEIRRLQKLVEHLNSEYTECVIKYKEELESNGEPGWTPITSVEQVEGLAAGFYEFRKDNKPNEHWVIIKTPCRIFGMYWDQYQVKEAVGATKGFDNTTLRHEFDAYKLIRAFEPAAPSIPEGAVLNTLENRRNAESGNYIFRSESINRIVIKNIDVWVTSRAPILRCDSAWFEDCQYFTKITDAALEALAKGER